MENLSSCAVRNSISQERIFYIPDESKVDFQVTDGNTEEVFDSVEWLAAMCSHVLNKSEQEVRYYCYYTNAIHGKDEERGL